MKAGDRQGTPGHDVTLSMALVTASLLLALQIAGKAMRDTLFLSHFPATDLPKAMGLAALLSIATVLLVSRLMSSYGPARVMLTGLLLSCCLFLGEWLAIGVGGGLVVMVVYLHTSVLGAILISGFWSVLNERFDPYAAKQAFGGIAAAATLGGILGAVIAQEVAAFISVDYLLVVLAGMSVVALLTLQGIGGSSEPPATAVADESASFALGLRVLAGSSYLRWVALLVLCVAMVSTLLDYAVKVEAAARLDSKDALIDFFSKFYAAVGLVTFLIQPMLGRRVLQRFGLAASMAVLPLIVLLVAGGAALFTRLWTVVIAKGAEMVLANSFFRSGFELLYTPLPRSHKRAAKTLVDVGAQRLGDALGSGLILMLLSFIPVLPSELVLALAMVMAMLALYAIIQLHRGYVEQLEKNLRSGDISLDVDEAMDFTTRQTLVDSRMAVDRASLLEQIEDLHRHQLQDQRRPPDPDMEKPGHAPISTPVVDDAPSARLSALVRGCAVLDSGNPDAIRRLLASGPPDARLVPQVLGLLADEELHEAAHEALLPFAGRILGQMVDRLLDESGAAAERLRLPRLIAAADSQRAVSALMAGLSDERFDVRYFSARALSQLLSRNQRLQVDEATVLEVVRREVAVSAEVWRGEQRCALAVDSSPAESVVGITVPAGGNYSLEHVFTLLGLVLERRVLRLSMHAVQSSDQQMRGTALEYLENVLPEDIRRGLWSHLQGW